jgi:hypothetical protein
VFVFPKASDYKLSGTKSQVLSAWAAYEGQILHDMVAYCHKLNRGSPNSADAKIMALKAMCPTPRAPATRKRKSPDESPKDRCHLLLSIII